MTKADIQALIDTNLASASAITAVKHREVETALLDYVDNALAFKPLLTGNLAVGNVADPNTNFDVTFSDLGTSNYIVTGSVVGAKNVGNNSVVWVITAKTSTSFSIQFGDTSGATQSISFDYIIFKK